LTIVSYRSSALTWTGQIESVFPVKKHTLTQQKVTLPPEHKFQPAVALLLSALNDTPNNFFQHQIVMVRSPSTSIILSLKNIFSVKIPEINIDTKSHDFSLLIHPQY